MAKLVTWIQVVLLPAVGPFGLFLVAFLDSSVLSLPEANDLLVVAGAAARPGWAWLYALLATTGSVAGCFVLWHFGRKGGEALIARRFGPARLERTRAAYRRWNVLALAVPALLPPPMPFKVFVFAAGAFGMSWRRFALTTFVARGLRYGFWALLGSAWGPGALDALRRVDAWFGRHGNGLLLALGLASIVAALAVYLRRRLVRPTTQPGPSEPEASYEVLVRSPVEGGSQ